MIVYPDTTGAYGQSKGKVKSKALPEEKTGARSELKARIWEIVGRLDELREGNGPILIVHDYACTLVELSAEYLNDLMEGT